MSFLEKSQTCQNWILTQTIRPSTLLGTKRLLQLFPEDPQTCSKLNRIVVFSVYDARIIFVIHAWKKKRLHKKISYFFPQLLIKCKWIKIRRFYFIFSCVKLWVEKKMLREIFFFVFKIFFSVGFKHDHQIFFMCEIWVGRNFGGKKLDDLICPVSFTPGEKKKNHRSFGGRKNLEINLIHEKWLFIR